MIVVAAATGLSDAMAVAFVALGTGLLALGGLAGRLEGPLEIGTAGEGLPACSVASTEQKHEAELQDRPEEAERLGDVVGALDDWHAEYLRELLEHPEPDPFMRAARLKRAYDRRHRSSEQA